MTQKWVFTTFKQVLRNAENIFVMPFPKKYVGQPLWLSVGSPL